MKLPPNLGHPAVQASIRNAKEAFGGYAIDCVMQAIKDGQSATGIGAVVMTGLLDATLEQFLVWHQSQGLLLDEEAFLDLVRQRLAIAQSNVTKAYALRRAARGLQ